MSEYFAEINNNRSDSLSANQILNPLPDTPLFYASAWKCTQNKTLLLCVMTLASYK